MPEGLRAGFIAALGDGFSIQPFDPKNPTLLRFKTGTLSAVLVVRLRAVLADFSSVSTGKQNSSAGASARPLAASGAAGRRRRCAARSWASFGTYRTPP